MKFGEPKLLSLLVLIPALLFIYYYGLRKKQRLALRFANFDVLARITAHGSPFKKYYILLLLRLLAITMLIIALASPKAQVTVHTTKSDIVLAIDVSGSMKAVDYKPNRLEAAKEAALAFVEATNPGDRVGVVTFSGVSRIVVPLTDDRALLEESIRSITFGREDGTAIGDGLVASASLLSGTTDRKKVVVLLSDGQNNRGVAPEDAAMYAKTLGIRVYTVGLGTAHGFIPEALATTGLDEATLKKIAETTGGEYKLARSKEALVDIYRKIARQIGTEVKEKELWHYFAVLALILLAVEFSLSATKFRIMP